MQLVLGVFVTISLQPVRALASASQSQNKTGSLFNCVLLKQN